MHEEIGSVSQSVQMADNGSVDMPENKFLSCATADQGTYVYLSERPTKFSRVTYATDVPLRGIKIG